MKVLKVLAIVVVFSMVTGSIILYAGESCAQGVGFKSAFGGGGASEQCRPGSRMPGC